MLILLSTAFISHVTFNPNEGALSGGYFHTTLRVPHGSPGLHTTKLNISIPIGVYKVIPEVPSDWVANITYRDLHEIEQYASHGMHVTQAPSQIILEATSHDVGVHNDYLLNIDLQLKVGCVLNDANTNTVWNNEYTTWWRVEQTCESEDGQTTETLLWNGIQAQNEDGTSPSWSDLPEDQYPAPYIYIEPGNTCTIDHSGNHNFHGGLNWFGSFIGEGEATITSVVKKINTTDAFLFASTIVSLVISSISIGCLMLLIFLRFSNKQKFAEQLLGVQCRCSCSIPQNNI